MPSIEEVPTKAREILVQVSKEPIGSKGARITSQYLAPGRYVVYADDRSHRRLAAHRGDKERQAAPRHRRDRASEGCGRFIVRTACEGVSKREIVADMRFLARLWTTSSKKSNAASAPALLHADLDIVLRAVRDLFTSDV